MVCNERTGQHRRAVSHEIALVSIEWEVTYTFVRARRRGVNFHVKGLDVAIISWIPESMQLHVAHHIGLHVHLTNVETSQAL